MAVKIQNDATIRKAQRWNEQDDAALSELLHKKIREVNLAIKEASTPYARAKLKAKRNHYRIMSKKIDNGTYNGDIIFSEMQAAAALRIQQDISVDKFTSLANSKRYLNSYEDMDFDYEGYFRKSRFYGVSLPIIQVLLSLIFIAFFIIGAIIPTDTKKMMSTDYGIKVDTLYYFKIDSATDIKVLNDGNWPDGDWKYVDGVEDVKSQGKQFVAEDNTTPEYVYLYKDLGMRTINISAFDVVKAWFRTKMLSKVRLDFLENNDRFKGPSYFYTEYLANSSSLIKIEKNADGGYDVSIIMRHIATYGSIIFLIAAFLAGVISLFINFIRIFTYTSRRLHSFSWMALIFSALAILLPAIMEMSGTDIVLAYKNYFVMDHAYFMSDTANFLMLNIFAFIPVGIAFLLLINPRIFRNKLKKRPTFIPSGNLPRKIDEERLDEIAHRRVINGRR